jgi:hypothetical protein
LEKKWAFRILGSRQSTSAGRHAHPNLNPIENVWALFKTNYRKAVWKRQKIPRNEKELIELAQEVWEALPWGRIYSFIDSMPIRVANCLKRGGGLTHW